MVSVEEIKRWPSETMRDRTEHIGKIKENNMESLLSFLAV